MDMKKRVGEFVIDQGVQLGRGQFGTVYESFKEQDPNKKYAVKVIEKSKVMTEEEHKKIMEEGNNLIRAQGMYIVPLVSVASSKKNLYYFMELCQQGSLAQYMKKHQDKLKEPDVINIFRMIVKGYHDQLYQNDIMHRDIKPENILIQDDIPKFADFGLAKLSQNVDEQIQQTQVGTPLYQAPQLVMREEYSTYSYKADIFSLGMMFYQMLHGFTPGKPSSMLQLRNLMEQLRDQGPKKAIQFPPTRNIQVSQEAKNCIWDMLQYHEKDRIGIVDLLNHKLFDSISFQQKDAAIDMNDDIGMSLRQGQQQIQNRGTHITKLKSDQVRQPTGQSNGVTTDDVDKFFMFMRNTAIFSNTVLVNLYNNYRPLKELLNVPSYMLDRILMCLSKHYTQVLQLLKFLLESKRQIESIPYNPDYFQTKMYQFSLNNLQLETEQAEKQHDILIAKMRERSINGKDRQEYMDICNFMANEKQIDRVKNEFKRIFRQEILDKIKQLLPNPPDQLKQQVNLLRTIFAMGSVAFDVIDIKCYKTFSFPDSVYNKFNLPAEDLIKLIQQFDKQNPR